MDKSAPLVLKRIITSDELNQSQKCRNNDQKEAELWQVGQENCSEVNHNGRDCALSDDRSNNDLNLVMLGCDNDPPYGPTDYIGQLFLDLITQAKCEWVKLDSRCKRDGRGDTCGVEPRKLNSYKSGKADVSLERILLWLLTSPTNSTLNGNIDIRNSRPSQ